MDLEHRLAISYYQTIGVINEAHQVYLVQHQETKRIYVKKILDIYNLDVYEKLYERPVSGTPRIIDYCEIDGQLVLIEEYISGIPLSEAIEKHSLTTVDIFCILLDLCYTLEHLHTFSPPIIHRDIKPSNILLADSKKTVLLDFNAAKEYSTTDSEDTVLLGTQGYAAPEQYGFGSSSPQTDIYSLGIVLKEMLNSCDDEDEQLEMIAKRCTQLEPKKRYSSVIELRDSLTANIKSKTNHRRVKRLQKFVPPGYRTLTPWKIILATVTYLFLILLTTSLTVENCYGAALWIERFFFLAVFLVIIAGSFNYMGIQRFIPLCRHRSRGMRYLGIFLLDFILALGVMLLLMIFEDTIMPYMR